VCPSDAWWWGLQSVALKKELLFERNLMDLPSGGRMPRAQPNPTHHTCNGSSTVGCLGRASKCYLEAPTTDHWPACSATCTEPMW
jgi:hypothetical protein